ncbi:Fc receptor-like protein 5 isoform X2 [Sebastes fasciatus]|uniref:Fc receptor-like protein 5 isoform X2 n=1 Tax=Sebastes fasciatus TaxID=394691 RepID=UPI003D9ECC0E
MEVTALCIRLLMNVLMLLVAQVPFSYSQKAAFPQVVPNRQQHFQYETIVFSCEGLEGRTGWRVMRKIKGVVNTCAATWSTSTGPCVINDALTAVDSGEYWCEIGGLQTSNTVNITVTAGSVILESPVLPVMVGDDVTLSCRDEQASSNLTADFFKDGHFMESSSTGEMTIHSVSRSNEGLYKCDISGAGESPESWLTVRVAADGPQLLLLLCIGVAVFLVFLLLLLVGSMQCRRRPTITRDTPTSPSALRSSSSPRTVCEETSMTYSAITKPRRKEEPGVSICSETPVLFAGSNHLFTEENPCYCMIE